MLEQWERWEKSRAPGCIVSIGCYRRKMTTIPAKPGIQQGIETQASVGKVPQREQGRTVRQDEEREVGSQKDGEYLP